MLDHSLASEELQNDPRVATAKKLLLEAVNEHRQKLKSVKPPHSLLKESYKQLLKDFGSYRGAKLYFPYIGSGLGNGPFVELSDGSVKYDFICGIGPHYFGHSHLDLISACIDGAISDTVMQGNLQQNQDSVELSKLLVETSKLPHCFFSTSGVMAVENGLKIAFQKRNPAHRILAFDHCFAGRTLVASQITDKPAFRDGLPINYFVDYIPYYNPERPKESVEALKKHLSRYPKQHAVMIFELIQGEAGFYTAPREFFVELMEILKEHQVLILDDEVQCFGRTTELFAFHDLRLEKYVDIVTIGKLSQICATLFNDEVAPRAGLLSQTFTASTSAIRAGKQIIKLLIEGNYYGKNGKIAQIHHHFVQNLKDIQKRHPNLITGPFGVGTMVAFTPLDGSSEKVTQFVQRLFEEGVIAFVAGSNPTRARFLIPAPVITGHDMDEVTKIIEKVLLL